MQNGPGSLPARSLGQWCARGPGRCPRESGLNDQAAGGGGGGVALGIAWYSFQAA